MKKEKIRFKEQYELENALHYKQPQLVCENESCMCPSHCNAKTDGLL